MRNEEEATEVMQEVFMRALQYGEQFRGGESSPYTWIYRITTHLCLNKIRHFKVTKIIGDAFEENTFNSGKSPEKTLVNTKAFYKVFDKLTEEEQMVISFYYVDGLTQEEVAQNMGLSRKTIYHRLKSIEDRFIAGGLNYDI